MDLIERQAAINAIDETWTRWDVTTIDQLRDKLHELFLVIPSAQPEIIRCKDCRFWQDQKEGIVEVPICARPQNKHDKHPFVMIMGADDSCSLSRN